jgi:zinc/manganese transport system ATP-binding protein
VPTNSLMRMAGPAVSCVGVTLAYGDRRVWSDLTLDVAPGSFVAILGPNGAGKTSLLKAILGLVAPSDGEVSVFGRPPRRGDPAIGYIPQHQSFDRDLPMRGRDLVRMGIDGHRWGIGLPDARISADVDRAIASVDATGYANGPIGRLSGGELQRLRIAQALVGGPRLLLCDEPLASLDLHHQQAITDLIAGWRRDAAGTVLFVTHDVNPVLHLVDRLVFVVNGRWAAGTPDEVLTSERMSDLYGSHVDVVRVHGRVLVVGESTESGFNLDEPHHVPDAAAVLDHRADAR